MAYAVESRKRKFHRLLESISNNGVAVGARSARTPELAAADMSLSPEKRRRLGAPQTSTSLPPSAKVVAARLVASTSKAADDTTTSTMPTMLGLKINGARYAPSDRSALILRIKTYQSPIGRWARKPAVMNELEFAKNGWVCIGKEEVACVYCHSRMEVPYEAEVQAIDEATPDAGEEEKDGRRELLERLKSRCVRMMHEEHDDGCPWEVKPSTNSTYKIAVYPPLPALMDLFEGFAKMQEMAEKLPHNITHTLSALNVSEFHVVFREVYHAMIGKPELSNVGTVWDTAALLALFGWRVHPKLLGDALECPHCLRQVPLRHYTSNGSQQPEPFDVFEQHRDYCPMISAISQDSEFSAVKGLHNALTHKYHSVVRGSTGTDMAASDMAAASNSEEGDKKRLRKVAEIGAFWKKFGKGGNGKKQE